MRLVLGVLLVSPACVEHERTPVCGDHALDEPEACDDGNAASGDGCTASCAIEDRIAITWRFVPMLGGPTGPCPADTIELVGRDASRRFLCAASHGELFATAGSEVFARLRNANDEVVAESLPQLPENGASLATFYGNAGYVHVHWQLSCRDPIELTIGSLHQEFPCAPIGDAYSAPIVAGTYDVTLDTQTKADVVIGSNNAITELAFAIP